MRRGERRGRSLARGTEAGMEPVDLLCSRKARPEKALVGRAQWKIKQPPSLQERTSKLGVAHAVIQEMQRHIRVVLGIENGIETGLG